MLLNKRPPLRYIFNKVKHELLYVGIVSIVVYMLNTAFEHAIPDLPLGVPAFLGTAMSVILSFKLSQSYDRWWEARKIWGGIVNDSRNLVLQLQSFVKKGNEAVTRRIALRHVAFCYCLGRSLRGLEPLHHSEHFLSNEDRRLLETHANKPLGILQLNNRDLADLRANEQLDTLGHIQLNTTMVNLTNQMGMAERIKSTVFPVTYRLFLHMIIYVFLVTLSLSLRDLGYFQVPLLLVITSFFFLLERTATHLQDPFSNKPTDTALTAIATTIEINIKNLLNDAGAPKPLQPEDYYLM
jgi:putative membrane protein